MEISEKLKHMVLSQFNDIKPKLEQAAKNLKNLRGEYVNFPFIAGGIPTNEARWNIEKQRFDQLKIPVFKDEEVVEAIIEI